MSFLDEHGTKAFRLKPLSVAKAAMADIERHHRNKRRSFSGGPNECEWYAFVRYHVRHVVKNGGGAKELVQHAIDHRLDGKMSSKRMTKLIYGDLKLLCGALLAFGEDT